MDFPNISQVRDAHADAFLAEWENANHTLDAAGVNSTQRNKGLSASLARLPWRIVANELGLESYVDRLPKWVELAVQTIDAKGWEALGDDQKLLLEHLGAVMWSQRRILRNFSAELIQAHLEGTDAKSLQVLPGLLVALATAESQIVYDPETHRRSELPPPHPARRPPHSGTALSGGNGCRRTGPGGGDRPK